MKYLFTSFCLLLHSAAIAFTPMKFISFQLMVAEPSYEDGETIDFTLRITNGDKEKTWPIMIPGPTNDGKKLIFMTAYTVDSKDHYTEVAREEVSDVPASSGYSSGNTIIKQLKPGEHLDIKFKFFSRGHYSYKSSERHWFNKPLEPGVYQFIAWYQPWGIVPFDLYHYPTGFHNEDLSTTKLNFDRNGEPSTYCRVEIKKKDPSKIHYGKAEFCPPGCSFCADIGNGRWNSVRQDIELTTRVVHERSEERNNEITTHASWLSGHKNVVYLSPPPESILSSLPTYWGQTIGFKSRDSILYFNMTFQLGIVYPGRSRLQTMWYCIFGSGRVFKTSDIDYIGLKYFELGKPPAK